MQRPVKKGWYIRAESAAIRTLGREANTLRLVDERTYGYESVGTINCTPSTGFRRLYTILIRISSYSGPELWGPCIEGPGVCGSGVDAVGLIRSDGWSGTNGHTVLVTMTAVLFGHQPNRYFLGYCD